MRHRQRGDERQGPELQTQALRAGFQFTEHHQNVLQSREKLRTLNGDLLIVVRQLTDFG